MNDRYVTLLEQYEVEVSSTRKGRGAILCETNQGTLIFKEYGAHREKILFQDAVLSLIRSRGFYQIEGIIKNKEGELLTQDQDGTSYVLKTYFEGRECNVRDRNECAGMMQLLAKLHRAALANPSLPYTENIHTVSGEFEKHNKELRRVRKFLKEKSQKTDFEIYLMQCYDYFFNCTSNNGRISFL